MKITIKIFSGFGSIETFISKFGPLLVIKFIKKYSYQNMSMIKCVLLSLYSSMKKKSRKIRLIFDVEK